jgi:hypothetical protein
VYEESSTLDLNVLSDLNNLKALTINGGFKQVTNPMPPLPCLRSITMFTRAPLLDKATFVNVPALQVVSLKSNDVLLPPGVVVHQPITSGILPVGRYVIGNYSTVVDPKYRKMSTPGTYTISGHPDQVFIVIDCFVCDVIANLTLRHGQVQTDQIVNTPRNNIPARQVAIAAVSLCPPDLDLSTMYTISIRPEQNTYNVLETDKKTIGNTTLTYTRRRRG